jgi:hypothetical protein
VIAWVKAGFWQQEMVAAAEAAEQAKAKEAAEQANAKAKRTEALAQATGMSVERIEGIKANLALLGIGGDRAERIISGDRTDPIVVQAERHAAELWQEAEDQIKENSTRAACHAAKIDILGNLKYPDAARFVDDCDHPNVQFAKDGKRAEVSLTTLTLDDYGAVTRHTYRVTVRDCGHGDLWGSVVINMRSPQMCY